MFNQLKVNHAAEDEAEKPFWISYADLMTALMVLFLVVMLASLVALTRTVSSLQDTRTRSEELAVRYKSLKKEQAAAQRREGRHQQDIRKFWDEIEASSEGLGVNINRQARVIDFGSRARFESGSDVLAASDQLLLRQFTPALLDAAQSDLGSRVLSRVIVEGYTDQRGSYLFNLNLSLNRSQRVLCTLLEPGGSNALSTPDKGLVRDLFLVGGFSFNSSRRSLAASRRVEIRLEFLPVGGKRRPAPPASPVYGDCSLS